MHYAARTTVNFDRVALDVTHQSFRAMADALRARTRHILDRWRYLSLNAMPGLRELSLEQFEYAVAAVLAAAADAFQSADPAQLRGVMERATLHGIDRFVQTNSVLDLFEEVRILRGVAIIELAEEMGRPLYVAEAATFHAIFDLIIQQGVMGLVNKQMAAVQQAQSTMRDINQRFLVTSVQHDELIEQAGKTDQALRQSEERYRTLFDLGPVAIYAVDSSGVIQNFNRQAANLWGREPAIGDTEERFCGSLRMFHPDGTFMPHDQCPMADVVSGRVSEIRDAEIVIERPDGSRVTIVVNIRPLKNARGKVTGAVNCFYDITERKRSEEAKTRLAEELARHQTHLEELVAERTHALKRSLEQLRRAERLVSIGTLTAGIAHEINNPLGSISLMATYALRGKKPVDQTETMREILSEAERATRIVQNMLKFAREEVTTKAPMDLNEVVRRAVDLAATYTRSGTVHVQMELDGNLPLTRINPLEIEQVLVNLIKNAAEAASGPIRVNIRTTANSDGVHLSVSDDGPGIPEDIQPHIFDPFFTTKRSSGGSGLGLSLCHGIISEHGGRMSVQSLPGAGTTFTIELPVEQAGTAASER